MEKVIKKYRPCVTETLRRIPVGESMLIKPKDIKPQSVRSCVRFLRLEGYKFEATEKGLKEGIKVTKLGEE